MTVTLLYCYRTLGSLSVAPLRSNHLLAQLDQVQCEFSGPRSCHGDRQPAPFGRLEQRSLRVGQGLGRQRLLDRSGASLKRRPASREMDLRGASLASRPLEPVQVSSFTDSKSCGTAGFSWKAPMPRNPPTSSVMTAGSVVLSGESVLARGRQGRKTMASRRILPGRSARQEEHLQN